MQPCFLAWESSLDKDLRGQEQGWGLAGHRCHCQGAGMSLCPDCGSPTCQPGAGPTCRFLSISLLVSKSSSSSPKGLMICSATWGGREPGETGDQGQGHLPTGLSIPQSTHGAHETCRLGAPWCPGVTAGPRGCLQGQLAVMWLVPCPGPTTPQPSGCSGPPGHHQPIKQSPAVWWPQLTFSQPA